MALQKTPSEIAKMRRAAEHVDSFLVELAGENLRPGITEKEFTDLLDAKIKSGGTFELSFDSIVAFGEGAAEPHHVPRADRRLTRGDCILIDCGAKFEGFCSDMTRNFYLGTPSEEYLKKFQKVLEVHESLLPEFIAGADCAVLDQSARERLGTDAEFFIHTLGHGVGAEVHEPPRISCRKKVGDSAPPEFLLNQMVVTCEPGLYFAGKFGIRIEDQLVIGTTGSDILTRTPRTLIVL